MNFKEFSNLPQLLRYYADEKVCREYLAKQRWAGKPECPFCGNGKLYIIEGGKRYKCANNQCYKKFSVTVGTVFENTNVPLNLWFGAIYLASAHKKGISSLQLSRDLGVTQRTAWFMLHRIRQAFQSHTPEILDNVVEADETYVGGKYKNKHANKKKAGGQGGYLKSAVMGLVEREGKVKSIVLPNTEMATMQTAVLSHITPTTLLITDAHNNYRGLHQIHPAHIIVKTEKGNYITDKLFHTNTIEGYWSLVKRGIIGIYHYVSPKHLHRYMNEFDFRYNNRGINDSERFVLSLSKIQGRLKYAELVSNPLKNKRA